MRSLRNWLGRWWRHLLTGAIVIALLLGVIGMIISRENERTSSRCQERYEKLEEKLDWYIEENSRLRQENNRRWEEHLRLPELTIERGVRIPGSDDWTDYLEAKTGQRIEFIVRVSSNVTAHNLWIRADLPALIIYRGNLKVDGITFFGDVTEGINIGTVTDCTERVITWEAQTATASLFPVGTNTLIVPIEVWADCVEAEIGEISIVVERKAPASVGGRSSRPPDECPPGGPVDPPSPGDGRD